MTELWRLSASEVSTLVRGQQVSAQEVTNAALARLVEVNPAINAVVTEMPEEALANAKEIDARLAKGEDPGMLCGAPVTIKVNVDQAGYATTNGLRLQSDLIAETDSPVVSNLRAAGAVIVGRTNTPAFSLRWFTRNSLHGHTRNPHNPNITPGGSSGGAAAAVASGICTIGHGTDIGGSIRYPAYACGIHGLRPTLGRVPAVNFTAADRHIGAQLMAVSGPLARTISDLRLSLHALAARDLRDPWWTPVAVELPLSAKRVALSLRPDGLTISPEVEAALLDAADRLADAGWDVEETECPSFRQAVELQLVLWLSEFRRSAAKMVGEEGDPDACMVYEQLEAICGNTDMNRMLDALQSRVGLAREWSLFLEKYPVMLCPVSAELPFPDLLDVESPAAFERVYKAQLTQLGLPLLGLPGLAVTTNIVENTPVGVQLIGDRFQENALLLAAEDIEQRGGPLGPVDPQL